jgi:hypothetical protein
MWSFVVRQEQARALGRTTGIRVAAGWEADSEIDRQFLATTRGSPTELPALAFCLLFRFQGAEARNALSVP